MNFDRKEAYDVMQDEVLANFFMIKATNFLFTAS